MPFNVVISKSFLTVRQPVTKLLLTNNFVHRQGPNGGLSNIFFYMQIRIWIHPLVNLILKSRNSTWTIWVMFLPPQGFRLEGEIPRRHSSNSRVYQGKCLQLKYTVIQSI